MALQFRPRWTRAHTARPRPQSTRLAPTHGIQLTAGNTRHARMKRRERGKSRNAPTHTGSECARSRPADWRWTVGADQRAATIQIRSQAIQRIEVTRAGEGISEA